MMTMQRLHKYIVFSKMHPILIRSLDIVHCVLGGPQERALESSGSCGRFAGRAGGLIRLCHVVHAERAAGHLLALLALDLQLRSQARLPLPGGCQLLGSCRLHGGRLCAGICWLHDPSVVAPFAPAAAGKMITVML